MRTRHKRRYECVHEAGGIISLILGEGKPSKEAQKIRDILFSKGGRKVKK